MMEPQVFIIDDDDAVRDSMSLLFESADIAHCAFDNADQFMAEFDGTQRGCLVLDMRMPGLSGLELQQRLNARNARLPIIFITGHGDVPMAVEAMRRGAVDFLRKPVNEGDFLERIQQALQQEADGWDERCNLDELQQRVATLTAREREVFALVGEGGSNKLIASSLGISERTVEVHRSQVMKKLEVTTLAQLVRIYLQSD